jgi:hypothetical protein
MLPRSAVFSPQGWSLGVFFIWEDIVSWTISKAVAIQTAREIPGTKVAYVGSVPEYRNRLAFVIACEKNFDGEWRHVIVFENGIKLANVRAKSIYSVVQCGYSWAGEAEALRRMGF